MLETISAQNSIPKALPSRLKNMISYCSLVLAMNKLTLNVINKRAVGILCVTYRTNILE